LACGIAEQPMIPPRVIAAFDFDGTITTSDSLRDFVRYTAGNVRFMFGALRTAPWLVGMLLGMCDRGTAKARFLRATLGAMREADMLEAARRYVEVRLPALIRPEMVARVREHQRCAHTTVLVSASPTLYLQLWAKHIGFDAVLATELAFPNGRFTGRLASPNCWGPEKVRRLQQWSGEMRPRIGYAYGDSLGDREMLALADIGWLRGNGPLPAIDRRAGGA
jgi:phosphatidylglycerophosphatase C